MPEEHPVALRTYRYLRIALVSLVLWLAAAVVVEWRNTGYACWQTSLSAYYYTPAQGVFVASLVAIGVCLVVVTGNSRSEDVLLNLAGMCALVVALVPTPFRADCYSVEENLGERASNVANNVTALLVVGGVTLVVGVVVTVLGSRAEPGLAASAVPYAGTLPSWATAASAALLLGGTTAVFLLDRARFLGVAHYAAAVAMLVLVAVVVVSNAVGYGRLHVAVPGARTPAWANRYLVVALAMGASVVAILVWWWVAGLSHVVLWLEATLTVLFGVFWVLQTVELWDEVRRPQPAGATGPGAAADGPAP